MRPAVALARPADAKSSALAFSRLLSNPAAPVRRLAAAGSCEVAPGRDDSGPFVGARSKLIIGAPDDPCERQADDVAANVMRMPAPAAPHPLPNLAPFGASGESDGPGRTCATPRAKAPQGVASALGTSRGGALPDQARRFFEPRFGRDLSHVRIHDGAEAATSARAINARAFTHGSDIYFARGQYDPRSTPGRAVLAHEIAHTLQPQSASTVRRLLGPGPIFFPITEILTKRMIEYLMDLAASIKEAPHYAMDVLGEVWEDIKKNWVSLSLVAFGFAGAQAIAAELAVLPFGATQIAAVIIEALIIGAAAYFAGAQVIQVGKAVMRWLNLVGDAHGDPKKIALAAKAFCEVILNIVFVLFAIVGVRRASRSFSQRKIVPGGGGGPTKQGPGSSGSGGSKPTTGGGGSQSGTVGNTLRKGTKNKQFQDRTAAQSKVGPIVKKVGGKKTATSETVKLATSGSTDVKALKSAVKVQVKKEVPQLRDMPSKAADKYLNKSEPIVAEEAPKVRTKPETEPGTDVNPREAIVVVPFDELTDKKEEEPEVRLKLSTQKARNADLYKKLVRKKTLQHQIGRPRNTRQRDIWDDAFDASAWPGVYDRGKGFGLCDRQIRRPTWTEEKIWPDMHVDHIVEHQVGPINDPGWIDDESNFQLLDSKSNLDSKDQFTSNIEAERKRLVNVTGDQTWSKRDLTFTVVEVPGESPVGRWDLQQIIQGKHLNVFEDVYKENFDKGVIPKAKLVCE
ncbi:MAG: hypothetical protein QOH47_1761 [Sphingomonadales bacterium]|jgi:hypothetical protein|nr:hypothetical protein [Sphingomonadales bacterium]